MNAETKSDRKLQFHERIRGGATAPAHPHIEPSSKTLPAQLMRFRMNAVTAVANEEPASSLEADDVGKRSLPPDLPAFVLFCQPAHQRFEVIHHRAGGDVFARRVFQ